MPRVVSLFLPSWSTDRLRRILGAAAPPVETPLVLVGYEGRRRVVLALDAPAQRAGLHVGMPADKAQALVPGLLVRDAETCRRRERPRSARSLGLPALRADRRRRPTGWRGD